MRASLQNFSIAGPLRVLPSSMMMLVEEKGLQNPLLFLLFMASRRVVTGVGRLVGKDILTELLLKIGNFVLSKMLVLQVFLGCAISIHILD